MCVGGYFMQVNLVVGYEMKVDTHIEIYILCGPKQVRPPGMFSMQGEKVLIS